MLHIVSILTSNNHPQSDNKYTHTYENYKHTLAKRLGKEHASVNVGKKAFDQKDRHTILLFDYDGEVNGCFLKMLIEIEHSVITVLFNINIIKTCPSKVYLSKPHFYTEKMGFAGVCRGIPIFLIFAPKHRLWELVRTASASRF